jgi:hypothetical protein
MSFFKNYSQNGAAQALVVLGLFTVAAEVVRTRTTKKRPYRDYGVGGMNEEDEMPGASDMDFDESTMGWGQAPMAQSQRPMAQSQRSMMQSRRPMAQDQGQNYKDWVGWEELAVGQGGFDGGHPSPSDMMDEMDELDEMAMMPSGQAMAQRFHEASVPAHRGVAGGYMNRAPSPWNEYVATEVPKLMKQGMSAPQAMKEAAKTFRRAEREKMGLPPSSKAPPPRSLRKLLASKRS